MSLPPSRVVPVERMPANRSSTPCSPPHRRSVRPCFARRPRRPAYHHGMAAAKTVLVVDDEPTIADVVARYLERDGYRPVVARDGAEALEVAERERPDLVVLDVMLPRLDGLQVMALLRQRRSVPVILLTARGDEPDRIAGLKLGADDYVAKPFSPAE